jgi:Putative auto-transporter adhesin, head GIN domain
MHLWVTENESVDLDLGGAGYITLGGRSKLLHATLGGLGGLNAQQFQADAVNVDLSGLGNATVTAKTSATLNLSGLGSVTVYGKPLNRNVSVDGLGKVTWK